MKFCYHGNHYANEYFLFSPKYKDIEKPFTKFHNLHPFFGGKSNPFWRQIGISKDLKKQKINIFHGLSHEIPFGLKKNNIKCKCFLEKDLL